MTSLGLTFEPNFGWGFFCVFIKTKKFCHSSFDISHSFTSLYSSSLASFLILSNYFFWKKRAHLPISSPPSWSFFSTTLNALNPGPAWGHRFLSSAHLQKSIHRGQFHLGFSIPITYHSSSTNKFILDSVLPDSVSFFILYIIYPGDIDNYEQDLSI